MYANINFYLNVWIFTYLHSLLGEYKTGNIPKRFKIERKLLLTAYIKSYTGFLLPPKCVTLNDLCERFNVIDSLGLNAAKMAKYSYDDFWESEKKTIQGKYMQ